jgi:hypothetical protein
MPLHLDHRPWLRNQNEAAALLQELQRRQLNTIDDCRIAWEEAADPLAVCVALSKCAIPEWVQDAALGLLTGERYSDKLRGFSRQVWARHTRCRTDAARAALVAQWRAWPELRLKSAHAYLLAKRAAGTPKTGHSPDTDIDMDSALKALEQRLSAAGVPEAAKCAREITEPKYADASDVSPDAMEKSYRIVRKGIKNRGDYYAAPGFSARLDSAFERFALMIERVGPSPVNIRPRQRRGRHARAAKAGKDLRT